MRNLLLNPREQGFLRSAMFLILIFGAAVILGIVAYAGGLRALFHWLTGLALLPLFLLLPATRLVGQGRSGVPLLLTVAANVGGGLLFYVDAFLIHPDPQSALILLSVPFCQTVAILVLYLFVYISRLNRQPRITHNTPKSETSSRVNNEG